MFLYRLRCKFKDIFSYQQTINENINNIYKNIAHDIWFELHYPNFSTENDEKN